jgi:chromosome segregation ATPase
MHCACRCKQSLAKPQTQVKLRAEANILSRANDKLKAEKAADAARVAALQKELAGMQQQLAAAGSVADKLRTELAERDGVISDNYVTMQGLRRRVQELETHRFVLTYKVSTL